MPVANQKVVSVNKEKCDTNNIYAKININAIENAMNDLTPA